MPSTFEFQVSSSEHHASRITHHASRTTHQVLVTDLDDTLLHPEPEAIRVWGRSGHRYLSRGAAILLSELSRMLPVVIATGRNAISVQRMVEQLGEVNFHGFVLENGLVTRRELDNGQMAADDEWDEVARLLPDWERVVGYENCLCMISPPAVPHPRAMMEDALRRVDKRGCVLYQERHKTFVYPHAPSKLSGIRALDMDPLIVVGDELNDLDMLEVAFHSGTLSTAHEAVRQCVRRKNGYCSPLASHAATEDLLAWAMKVRDEG